MMRTKNDGSSGPNHALNKENKQQTNLITRKNSELLYNIVFMFCISCCRKGCSKVILIKSISHKQYFIVS